MTTRRPRRTLREEPESRRAALIAATQRCLAERGVDGTSVREICARAGVSLGLVRHYFGGVDALIAETYRVTAAEVAGDLAEAIAGAASPRERLSTFVEASFRAELVDGDLLRIWLAFWSLVGKDEAIRAIHSDIYRDYRAMVETLIGDVAAEAGVTLDVHRAALGLTALLDGLWLELSLDRSTFEPVEAIAIVTDWIEGLIGRG